MEKDFYHYWFNGFEESLNNISGNDKNIILMHCAKSCSESYTKKIYMDEYEKSINLKDFLSKLKERFPEIILNIIDEK